MLLTRPLNFRPKIKIFKNPNGYAGSTQLVELSRMRGPMTMFGDMPADPQPDRIRFGRKGGGIFLFYFFFGPEIWVKNVIPPLIFSYIFIYPLIYAHSKSQPRAFGAGRKERLPKMKFRRPQQERLPNMKFYLKSRFGGLKKKDNLK